MRFKAFATDYDGTLATHGLVDEPTILSLERVQRSGRRLILVTGRILDELFQVFPAVDLFDMVVAENGALLYRPDQREETLLAPPPPQDFVAALRSRGVDRVSLGRVIISTWKPHDNAAREIIRDRSLDLNLIYNKAAVMILPEGVNKATGLRAGLERLHISIHDTIGVGDAENDREFLTACGLSVAVANALPDLVPTVDLVTKGERGSGVSELVDRLLAGEFD